MDNININIRGATCISDAVIDDDDDVDGVIDVHCSPMLSIVIHFY